MKRFLLRAAVLAGHGWLACWAYQHEPGMAPGYVLLLAAEVVLLLGNERDTEG